MRNSSRHRLQDDIGSAAAELVLVVPLFLAFLGAFLTGAQLIQDHQELADAARGAVEAAVVEQSPAASRIAAKATVTDDVDNGGLQCSHVSVSTNTAHFTPGGTVSVTVSCSAELPALAFVPLPSKIAMNSSKTAPIEPYRAIGT